MSSQDQYSTESIHFFPLYMVYTIKTHSYRCRDESEQNVAPIPCRTEQVGMQFQTPLRRSRT